VLEKAPGRSAQPGEELVRAHVGQYGYVRRRDYGGLYVSTMAIATHGDNDDALVPWRNVKLKLGAFRLDHRAQQNPPVRLLVEPILVALPLPPKCAGVVVPPFDFHYAGRLRRARRAYKILWHRNSLCARSRVISAGRVGFRGQAAALSAGDSIRSEVEANFFERTQLSKSAGS